MRLPSILKPTLAAVLALLLPTLSASEGGASLPGAYREAARMLCNEAADAFRAQAGREAMFGQAAALLNVQPRTPGNVDHAAALLGQVRIGSADDEPGIAATYLSARLEQTQREPADLPAALRLYDALYRAHPAHPLAQMALVKGTLLRLYDPSKSEPERHQDFDGAEQGIGNLTDHDARRDGEAVLAAACERFGYGDDRRLTHLLAQEAAGAVGWDVRRDLVLTIAEVARRLGRDAVAAEHYRTFLDLARRDPRRFTVQQRLAALH